MALQATAAPTTSDSISSESRPVTGVYSLELGALRTTATYLSPLHYHGTLLGANGRWDKTLPGHGNAMTMNLEGEVRFSRMLNPAGTASMMNVQTGFNFGLDWRHRLPYSLQLRIGGYYGIEGGAMWLFRNSNNPVEALFYTGVGASASLSWKSHIGRLPILLADRVRLPLAGVFFSPAYGESYYEIYLGNHDGLAHFGWPGNRFGIENYMSLTLDFGRTAMEIGYRFGMQNQEASHLVTREWSHTLSIGVIPGGIGLRNPKANVVNALY